MTASEIATPLALVTAGSRRLGRELVLHLARRGYDIALHYRSSIEEAIETATEVKKLGRRCELFKRDFGQPDQIFTLFPEVVEKMGCPTLLVNNASTFDRNSLLTTKLEEFDVDFAVHLKAPFFLSRDFGNQCKRGQIINIVDMAVVRNGTGYFTYLLSKKGLHDLTKMSAKELAPHIRVNAIAPGIILPPVGWEQEQTLKASIENPLKRSAGPVDIIHALDYLLSAEQVTGDCLFVDGGDHIDW